MYLCLLSAFALSQAYRTVTSIIAAGLQADFGISPDSLGAFAGLFGLSFGVTQLLMGIGMDLYGLRRTVLVVFPLAGLGAAVSALAPGYGWLMVGQLLIGVDVEEGDAEYANLLLRPLATNLVSLQLEMEPADAGEDDDHVHGPDCGHQH